MQSPIKLECAKALPLAHPADLLSIDYLVDQAYQGSFIGHDPAHGNFELVPPFPIVRFRGRPFKLMRVHIHKRSEHLVDVDEPAAFEVHLLHVPETCELGDHKLDDPKVVIGILYHVSAAAHSLGGLEDFIKMVPTRAALKRLSAKAGGPILSIVPTRLFPTTNGQTPDLQNWFHYEGSLTSFPYSEDVRWFVMRSEAAVDPGYVEDLECYAEQDPRPLQPLDRRLVVRSFD